MNFLITVVIIANNFNEILFKPECISSLNNKRQIFSTNSFFFGKISKKLEQNNTIKSGILHEYVENFHHYHKEILEYHHHRLWIEFLILM